MGHWKIHLAVFISFITLKNHAGRSPIPPLSGNDCGEESVLSYTVITSVVTHLIDPSGTNENPPRFKAKLKEVLHGPRPPKIFLGVLTPMGHDVDYLGGDSRSRIESWKKNLFSNLTAEKEYILVGKMESSNNTFLVSRMGAHDSTPEWRSKVFKCISKMRALERDKDKDIH